MKTIRSVSATLALAGLFAVAGAGAAQAGENASANCRQETKRVAVWPRTPPKAPQMAHFEDRTVTVCDKQAKSQKATDEQLAKDGDG